MIRLLLALTVLLAPQSAVFAEYIQSFDATIELQQDSSFVVTEEILYDFEQSTRHGIFRFIPTTHPQPARQWHQSRYMDIVVLEVLRNGEAEPYHITRKAEQVSIKIGDPDTTISGRQVYAITYRVMGGLLYHQNQDAELYWNVTGTEWQVPMKQVRATVKDMDGVLVGHHACYQGKVGETGSCNLPIVATSSVAFTMGYLGHGAGMTIATAVDPTVVQTVILERTPMVWVWGAGVLLWLMGLMWFAYTQKYTHKTGNAVVPQYEPYAALPPMYTGVLFDDALDPKDITAGIIALAHHGYLTIQKTEKKVLFLISVDDYTLTLVQTPDTAVSAFQRTVLHLLFTESMQVGQTVTLSALKRDRMKQRENFALVQTFEAAVRDDLVTNGFFQASTPWRAVGMSVAVLLVVGAVVSVVRPDTVPFLIPLGLLILVSGGGALLYMHRKRTRKGFTALEHLEGFKEFLSVTEKERYAFHNAPTKSPEQFMEYLPYAIAFGVEKEWADVFKDITIPNPGWYEGGSTGNFSAVGLTESLGAFSTAFAASSGTSASSGGGSVGGGAGGGGGGSW